MPTSVADITAETLAITLLGRYGVSHPGGSLAKPSKVLKWDCVAKEEGLQETREPSIPTGTSPSRMSTVWRPYPQWNALYSVVSESMLWPQRCRRIFVTAPHGLGAPRDEWTDELAACTLSRSVWLRRPTMTEADCACSQMETQCNGSVYNGK